MENTNKKIKFLNYIKTPLSEGSIAVLLSANCIRYERVQLYNDFVQSLFHLIFDTYMGDNFTSEPNRFAHFKWCWDRNINNFKNEGIIFENTEEAYDYFLEFIYETYYSVPEKENKPKMTSTICELWEKLFSQNTIKTRSDIDNFLDVYNILDNSLKKS
jgi:hypothetical protein